jgi:septum formation protein
VAFSVRVADIRERTDGVPEEVAGDNARRKALGVEVTPSELALGVDTVVVGDGRLWGKPADEQAAHEALRALAGRTHLVISGVALVRGGRVREALATTQVTFRELGDDAISRYVATGEWRERAGGYAIQERGAALVRRIEGDYLNVVGLPVATLLDLEPGLI